jgi:hypothetical protein
MRTLAAVVAFALVLLAGCDVGGLLVVEHRDGGAACGGEGGAGGTGGAAGCE